MLTFRSAIYPTTARISNIQLGVAAVGAEKEDTHPTRLHKIMGHHCWWLAQKLRSEYMYDSYVTVKLKIDKNVMLFVSLLDITRNGRHDIFL